MKSRSSCSSGRDRQREPRDDVFKDSHAKNQSRELRVQNFEIGKDLGDDWNGCFGDTYRKHNCEGNEVTVGAFQRRTNQPWGEEQAEKRQIALSSHIPGRELLHDHANVHVSIRSAN